MIIPYIFSWRIVVYCKLRHWDRCLFRYVSRVFLERYCALFYVKSCIHTSSWLHMVIVLHNSGLVSDAHLKHIAWPLCCRASDWNILFFSNSQNFVIKNFKNILNGSQVIVTLFEIIFMLKIFQIKNLFFSICFHTSTYCYA